MNAKTTKLSFMTHGAYTWPVILESRWEVQLRQYGDWYMVGSWYDDEDLANVNAERMVRIGRYAAEDVRVVVGGWRVVRNATEADLMACDPAERAQLAIDMARANAAELAA